MASTMHQQKEPPTSKIPKVTRRRLGKLNTLLVQQTESSLRSTRRPKIHDDEDEEDEEMDDALPLTKSFSEIKEEYRKILQSTMEFILRNRDQDRLPFSITYLQSMTRSFLSDKYFLIELYDKLTSIFKESLVLEIQQSITSSKSPFLEFVEEYQSWKLTLEKLHRMFLLLDISTTLRYLFPDSDKPRRFKSFGIQLFSMELIYSRRPDNQDVTLYDREELFIRSKVMTSLYDKLACYLTVFEINDESKNEIENILAVFHEIDENEISISGSSKLRFAQLLQDMLFRICNDVREKWSHENKSTYISKCLMLKIRYNTLLESFELFEKDHFKLLLDQKYMFILFHNSVIIPVLAELFKTPETYKDQLLKLYVTCSQFNDWDKSSFINQFQSSTEILLSELLHSKILHHNKNNSSSLINSVLEFKEIRDSMIHDCFGNDTIFIASIQTLYNDTISKLNASTLLCDMLLKSLDSYIKKSGSLLRPRNGTVIDAQSVNKLVKSITTILEMIPDKRHYFFDKYQIQLTIRILRGGSHIRPNNDDLNGTLRLERLIVDELTKSFGDVHTDKLASMITDMVTSNRILGGFADVASSTGTQIELDVACLQGDHWREPPENRPIKLIPEILCLIADYEKFYKKSRSVDFDWKYHFQRLVIDVQFDDSDDTSIRSVDCSIYQATILLSFQDYDQLDLSQLLNFTGLEREFLLDNLNLLSKGKYHILSFDGLLYSINSGFTDPRHTIKLPMGLSDDLRQQVGGGAIRRGQERDPVEMLQLSLQAFITRQVKVNQKLLHDSLINCILSYLKSRNVNYLKLFNGSTNKFISFVKSVIDGLINDEYIVRDIKEKDLYLYVA